MTPPRKPAGKLKPIDQNWQPIHYDSWSGTRWVWLADSRRSTKTIRVNWGPEVAWALFKYWQPARARPKRSGK